ncbi:MAG: acetyl-CoA carboxylase carboxyltransferase subunit alpha [Gemmatimonadetes bacterium]|nr:MAG: acetyl-CoA carboxylase carboxyltransferase subunit alpha [Gemmatimonadota bacterium]
MSEFILDFERPILELERKIDDLRGFAETENLEFTDEIQTLEEKCLRLKEEIYSNLTRWQRVQLARHPKRPYALDYIHAMLTDFVELHGDRNFADDKAIVGGLAKLEGQPIVVIGQQKGRDTKENLVRNFGMPHPEGYRKALRLMNLAAKFNRPILCLVDTPGAYPGIGAEERGQAEAIARNLREMATLPVPIIVVVIGEGASGGALGIGVGDRILMLDNTWFSVISPEGCAAILWRSAEERERAAEALKLAPQDLLELGIIDEIVPEPLGGAHRDPQKTAQNLKNRLVAIFNELQQLSCDDLIDQRIQKYEKMGVFIEE